MTQLEVSAGASSADAEFTRRAIEGDHAAFEELYRRHAPAAWRVAPGRRGQPGRRRRRRVRRLHPRALGGSERSLRRRRALPPLPADHHPQRRHRHAAPARPRPVTSSTSPTSASSDGAADELVDRVDRGLVATAFRSLPERWRTVLWLTEVEGVPPREAAAVLGLSPNGTAQLAVRARAALRARYLQAHLGRVSDESCRRTIELLGAYVAGGLAPRDVARVDQHLAGCDGCRARVHHLEDVGSGMALGVVPLPLALAGMVANRWRDSVGVPRPVKSGSLAPAKALGGHWAATVFAVGVWSLLAPGGEEAASPDRRPAISMPKARASEAAGPGGAGRCRARRAACRRQTPHAPAGHRRAPRRPVPPLAGATAGRPAGRRARTRGAGARVARATCHRRSGGPRRRGRGLARRRRGGRRRVGVGRRRRWVHRPGLRRPARWHCRVRRDRRQRPRRPSTCESLEECPEQRCGGVLRRHVLAGHQSAAAARTPRRGASSAPP